MVKMVSHAPALIVIHKCWRPVISAKPAPAGNAGDAGDAEIQRPGWQTLADYIAQIKHLSNRQVTVHGLDTGIHAGMTAFLARQDLCITARYGNWERPKKKIECRWRGTFSGQLFNDGGHTQQPKAEVIETIERIEVVAVRGAAEAPIIVEGPAAQHPGDVGIG